MLSHVAGRTGEHRERLVMIISVPPGVRTGYRPNTSRYPNIASFSRLWVLRNLVRLLTNGLWLQRPRAMTPRNFRILMKIVDRYVLAVSVKKTAPSLNIPVIHITDTI